MYTFLYPYMFLMLIPFFVLVFFMYFKGGKKINFLPFEDIKTIYKKNSFSYKFYFIILLILILLYITILAGPVQKNTKQNIKKNGIDIEIVLDVSYSMKAEDLSPNRLEVAKKVIKNYLSELKTDRVGIIVFAGKPFTSLPLNFDYKVVSRIVDKINIGTINQNNYYMQGTALGDALILASDGFLEKENREKVIILLTDGEANKGINPIVALNYIKQKKEDNIKIYTIGIGGLKPTFVRITNEFGITNKIPISGIDEKTLKKLSSETGGEYFRATDNETFEKIFEVISELEKKEIEVEEIKQINEKNIVFLYILLFFMLFFIIFKYRKGI